METLKRIDAEPVLSFYAFFAGLQYLLPATWTALKSKGADPTDLARVLSEQPSKLLGMTKSGIISKGFDADLMVRFSLLLFLEVPHLKSFKKGALSHLTMLHL
jgi:hypothetical protein